MVDGPGFEPGTSTMPTGTELSSVHQNSAEIQTSLEMLDEFAEFMRVNMRLEKRTVRETKANIRRFLENSNNAVSYKTVSAYVFKRENASLRCEFSLALEFKV